MARLKRVPAVRPLESAWRRLAIRPSRLQISAMPFYEFYCPQNHRIYTFLARTLGLSGKTPRCPDNPEYTLQKRPSRFAVIRNAPPPSESGNDPLDAMDEATLASLEREFSSLDENNPDPRQLAHLMRRMGEITGEKPGEEMAEMIARLEAGEDPDKLEETFGPLLDGEDGDAGPGDMPDLATPRASLLRRLRRPPARDTRVFEMSEWL